MYARIAAKQQGLCHLDTRGYQPAVNLDYHPQLPASRARKLGPLFNCSVVAEPLLTLSKLPTQSLLSCNNRVGVL